MTRRPSLVLLCGQNRSGTTLLQHLLDAHPELAVAPVEDGVVRALGRDGTTLSRLYESSFEELWQFLLEDTLLGVRRKRDWQDYLAAHPRGADVDRARADLRAGLAPGMPEVALLRAVFAAFFPELRDSLDAGRPLVMKTPKTEVWHDLLFATDPDALLVYCVRDPFQSFSSAQLGRIRDGELDPADVRRHVALAWSFAAAVEASASALAELRARRPTRVTVVRYEDVVADAAAVTRDLASFLGIEWTGVLLEPTVAGRSWASNDSAGLRRAGLYTDSVARRDGVVPPEARAVLDRRLGHVFRAWGYPAPADGVTAAQAARGRLYLGRLRLAGRVGRVRTGTVRACERVGLT